MSEIIAETLLPSGACLRLVHGDITMERVDAIVNAANASLVHAGGVAAAIVRQGGPQIQAESQAWIETHGPVVHSAPAITSGGNLNCSYVIHAVGPVWGSGEEDAKLSLAIHSSLQTADDLNLHSIALPAISTGIFGFPVQRGAGVILDTLSSYFGERPDSSLKEVRITLIDQLSVTVFAKEFTSRWPQSHHP